MHFVYFIEPYSDDYVIMGQSRIESFGYRLQAYRTTHPKIKVIGIQPVVDEEEARTLENELIRRFEVTNPERHRCEMLWNTGELQRYISEKTVEIEPILARVAEHHATAEKSKPSKSSNKVEKKARHTERERYRRENELGYREYLNANARAYNKRKRERVDTDQLRLFD